MYVLCERIATHLHQPYIISTQKQPDCTKGAVLFKMASIKKSCEIKGGSQEMAVIV